MSNRGLVVPVDGRRMISTGVGIALVVAGAILRFAVPATFTYGLNAHVVSVIVMLAGVFGLLLSLLVWGPLGRRRNHYGGFGCGAASLASPGGTHPRSSAPVRAGCPCRPASRRRHSPVLHAAPSLGDDSPHRSLVHPVVDYVRHVQQLCR